ncbi:hypothetical protein INT46_001260 [Mucor plumbeus]|uniref:Uncharacterized protein n=1 Tax=Mucor plumbeus TaxID=97098 RepID=A0A8H7QTA5_9FUNG|nr:hypothetical protein INT46_001260 [Mucor plumbeus]
MFASPILPTAPKSLPAGIFNCGVDTLFTFGIICTIFPFENADESVACACRCGTGGFGGKAVVAAAAAAAAAADADAADADAADADADAADAADAAGPLSV